MLNQPPIFRLKKFKTSYLVSNPEPRGLGQGRAVSILTREQSRHSGPELTAKEDEKNLGKRKSRGFLAKAAGIFLRGQEREILSPKVKKKGQKYRERVMKGKREKTLIKEN